MSNLYLVTPKGSTKPLKSVLCQNEEKELQDLLEKNLNLIPGDQINPDEPRRWLQVKREMPVPDPSHGGNRWSIDHFLTDQDGIPTFVECKRALDTRSRREVVGQMFDYAANGAHYWGKDLILSYLLEAVGATSADPLPANPLDSNCSLTELSEKIENNLREGQVRMIFFLERASQELKSIVEFLNKQMERAEVLIVEAKQFEMDGKRLVSPSLFGYTEQARLTKKAVTIRQQNRRKWDEVSFFDDAKAKVTPEVLHALELLYQTFSKGDWTLKWGQGSQTGTFQISNPKLSEKTIFVVYSDGRFSPYFANMQEDERVMAYAESLKDFFTENDVLDCRAEGLKGYPEIPSTNWLPVLDILIQKLCSEL